MTPIKLLSGLTAALLLTACGTTPPAISNLNPIQVYQIDIPQGNIVNAEMLASLRQGMEEKHVRLILGTPMLIDPFHPDRWDYIYSIEKGGAQREQRVISIYFDEHKNLARVAGDVVMQLRPSAADTAQIKQVVEVPPRPVKKSGWFGGLTDMAGLSEDTTETEPAKESSATEQPEEDKKDGVWNRVGSLFGLGGEEEAEAGEEPSAADQGVPGGQPAIAIPDQDFVPVESAPPASGTATDQATTPEPAKAGASTEAVPKAGASTEAVPDEEAGLFDGLLRGVTF